MKNNYRKLKFSILLQTVLVTALTVLVGGFLLNYVIDGIYNDEIADTIIRIMMDLGVKERCVILNKVIAEMMSAGYAPRLRDVTSMLQPPLTGVIQNDENIVISTNLGVPIVLKEGTYIHENFMKITDRILNL